MTVSVSGVAPRRAAMSVLIALSITHLLNDMIQSLIPAIYPIIKATYALDFAQIGLITLTFQTSAFLLQPVVGFVTDKRPMPYSMVAGMGFSLVGLIGLAHAHSFPVLLLAAACVGVGSAIFHPEATRMARNASGGRQGFAQGIFQIGGQTGEGGLGSIGAFPGIIERAQHDETYRRAGRRGGRVVELAVEYSVVHLHRAGGGGAKRLGDLLVHRDYTAGQATPVLHKARGGLAVGDQDGAGKGPAAVQVAQQGNQAVAHITHQQARKTAAP